MGLTHRQKKQKARQERLRHRGTQDSFRPPSAQELRTGRMGMYFLIGVLVVAFALLIYVLH
ncbi:MAG: hypothetical protein J6Y94_04440 [Bacteriovoracaceae bacterium]|nr:hypothetical protein [Bacteriovoracaceae bacterium]